MPLKSPFSVLIPTVSIPTFVFGSPTSALPNEPLLLSTTNPSSLFLTLSSYRSLSQHFAAGLKARHDFQPGERVFPASPNSIYTAVVFMGTITAGGIFVGAQHSFDVHDLSKQIEQTEPRVLLMSESLGSLFSRLSGWLDPKIVTTGRTGRACVTIVSSRSGAETEGIPPTSSIGEKFYVQGTWLVKLHSRGLNSSRRAKLNRLRR
ncbi:MAG: hypothetical protein Q9181_005985 [Wetmoreana brouardii]